MKLEINGKRNYKSFINIWKLNSTLLNNQWVTDQIKEEIKQYIHLNKLQIQLVGTCEMKSKQISEGKLEWLILSLGKQNKHK